jgi:ferritin-like metal-binding protein YciE
MLQRLQSTYDLAVGASLAEVGRDDLAEQLRKYLADAHAIEEQAIELLEKGPKLAGDEVLAHLYEEHLAETREHEELLRARLEAVGGDPSTLKDAALRLGALNWGAFFAAHPDTPGKLAAFAFAFEHLEIAGYEQLKRVAERAGDAETAGIASRILEQERAAAARIGSEFGRAAEASLASADVAR